MAKARRKRRPGPHYVDLSFVDPQSRREFVSLALRAEDLGPDAPYELGRRSDAPEGWVIPSSPERTHRFMEILQSYGGRVVSTRPVPKRNPVPIIKLFEPKKRQPFDQWEIPLDQINYWFSKENVLDYVMGIARHQPSGTIIEASENGFGWRFRVGRFAGEATVTELGRIRSKRQNLRSVDQAPELRAQNLPIEARSAIGGAVGGLVGAATGGRLGATLGGGLGGYIGAAWEETTGAARGAAQGFREARKRKRNPEREIASRLVVKSSKK